MNLKLDPVVCHVVTYTFKGVLYKTQNGSKKSHSNSVSDNFDSLQIQTGGTQPIAQPGRNFSWIVYPSFLHSPQLSAHSSTSMARLFILQC